jgi:hypothetical protein
VVPPAPGAFQQDLPYYAGAPAPSGLARFLGPNGAKAALIGAGVGLLFILLATFIARPFMMGPYGTYANSLGAEQAAAARAALDKFVSVPFLAVSLHVPAEKVTLQLAAGPVTAGFSLDYQSPVSIWNGLGLFAIALAAFVSVMLARPPTARQAVVQGVATCVPYLVGLLGIALFASFPIPIDPATFGAPAQSLGGASMSIVYGFPFVALAVFALVAGGLLGAVTGAAYLAITDHRPVGEVVREIGSPLAAPIGGAAVALALALGLSLPATAAIYAHLKSELPGPQYQAQLSVYDRTVFEMSPSEALYAYAFGHGIPLTANLTAQATYTGTAVGASGKANMGIFGWSVDGTTENPLTGPYQNRLSGWDYEWWVFLLPLLPLVCLTIGGYASAAWSREGAMLPLEGAKMAIPYAVVMLGLAWLSTVALGMDPSQSVQATFRFSAGADMILTPVLALAWGATFGALGGWIRQLRPGR